MNRHMVWFVVRKYAWGGLASHLVRAPRMCLEVN